MKKSILYRCFRLGAFPANVRAALEREGVVAIDEGVGGWFVMERVTAPGRMYRHRREWFLGSIAVTRARLVCYAFSKRQINIPLDDPRMEQVRILCGADGVLSIAFESSLFREGWNGVIEMRFHSDITHRFHDVLPMEE